MPEPRHALPTDQVIYELSCVPLEDDDVSAEWLRVRVWRKKNFTWWRHAKNINQMRLWFNMTDDQIRTMRNDMLLGTNIEGAPVTTSGLQYFWKTTSRNRLQVGAQSAELRGYVAPAMAQNVIPPHMRPRPEQQNTRPPAAIPGPSRESGAMNVSRG
jgi:hypothetical protein